MCATILGSQPDTISDCALDSGARVVSGVRAALYLADVSQEKLLQDIEDCLDAEQEFEDLVEPPDVVPADVRIMRILREHSLFAEKITEFVATRVSHVTNLQAVKNYLNTIGSAPTNDLKIPFVRAAAEAFASLKQGSRAGTLDPLQLVISNFADDISKTVIATTSEISATGWTPPHGQTASDVEQRLALYHGLLSAVCKSTIERIVEGEIPLSQLILEIIN